MPRVYYLPGVYNESDAISGQGEPMDARATAFAQAWLSLLPPARLSLMRFDSRLAECARLHAEYLHSRTGDALNQSMHVGRGGSMPNGRVIASGYALPREYSPLKNNVESCCRDGRDPAIAARSLAEHEPHKSHMLGLVGFEDRVVWAVANAGDDWVFIAAPPEGM